MLIIEKELPELYNLKHRNDSFVIESNENDILDKTLSPYLYNNDTMNAYLKRLQVLVYMLFDKNNIVRNFKNPTVDKYEYRFYD
jgi:hypothetical protein